MQVCITRELEGTMSMLGCISAEYRFVRNRGICVVKYLAADQSMKGYGKPLGICVVDTRYGQTFRRALFIIRADLVFLSFEGPRALLLISVVTTDCHYRLSCFCLCLLRNTLNSS